MRTDSGGKGMRDNCRNCGAPPKVVGCCEYCGTRYGAQQDIDYKYRLGLIQQRGLIGTPRGVRSTGVDCATATGVRIQEMQKRINRSEHFSDALLRVGIGGGMEWF